MSGGRLFRVLQLIGEQRPPAATGIVTGMAGPRLYRVSLQGVEYQVPAIGDATARTGEAVAVMMDTRTNQPLGMLGAVKP